MKLRKGLLVSAALVSALALSGSALADRGGHYGGRGGWHGGGVGAFVGGTLVAGALLAPWYYPGPYYYPSYRTVVEVVPSAPTVYLEQPRAEQPAASDAGNWWYYCNESKTYYPYVNQCAGPWQRVAPTPPAAR